MEGNVTERRLSVAITPLWLDSSANSTVPPPPGPENREITPRPEVSEDGLPPNKVQIQTTSDMPRIIVPPTRHHHRVGQSDTNFENTEVEELLAMMRETENLEEQGDILQYLVDTQGLDFNTGKFNHTETHTHSLANSFLNNFLGTLLFRYQTKFGFFWTFILPMKFWSFISHPTTVELQDQWLSKFPFLYNSLNTFGRYNLVYYDLLINKILDFCLLLDWRFFLTSTTEN